MRKYQAKFHHFLRNALRQFFLVFLTFFLSCFITMPVQATGQVLGIHILNINEIKQFRQIYTDDEWRYVTIPLTLADLDKKDDWQSFFDQAYSEKVIPIVRLSTVYDTQVDAWKIPSRSDIVSLANFLSQLDWHQDEKFVIVFNEVNHAKEWGGRLDPSSYANALEFTSNWFHSEGKNYKILPAAMDLAANNSSETMEAFRYLDGLNKADPEIFAFVDYWNSHSYPNPDFESSPTRTSQNSLRGFLHELDYLKKKTGKDFQVFITETGWVANNTTDRYLDDYYLYALQHIWNDPRVKAVTPFVMKGSPGPFADFSFFDKSDNATIQLFALQRALKQLGS